MFTKNEFLNTVVFPVMFLNLYGCLAQVRGSAGVRMIQLWLLQSGLQSCIVTPIEASNHVCNQHENLSQDLSASEACYWFVCNLFFTFAALFWTISSAFLFLRGCGSQTEALHSTVVPKTTYACNAYNGHAGFKRRWTHLTHDRRQ